MSDPLYKRDLLRLAASAAGSGRLTVPCGTGTAHNPACGDKVVVDVALEDGRIAALAHHTLACVLTQASAAILGADGAGMSRAEVEALHRAVRDMLEGGAAPSAPFDAYAVFDGAADHKNRHKCVLLPIEAVLAAFEALEGDEARG
jgi:nitrogen fixation protein NifU and related proteins